MQLKFRMFALVVLIGIVIPVLPAAAQSDCTFIGTLDSLALYHAPVTDPSQQKDVLPGGVPYTVTQQHTEHFYIAIDDAYGGWVDRRSGILDGDCDAIPVDDTPLSDFSTICTLTSASDIPFYATPALTQQSPNPLPPGSYIITRRSQSALMVRLDHAFGGWVPLNSGILNGSCDGLPTEIAVTGIALANARVWSAPNAQAGSILYTLSPGAQVVILEGPVRGPIRYDTADQGNWYRVSGEGRVPGWVWENRLSLDSQPRPGDPAQTTAITQANTRAWNAPNVQTGRIMAYLPAGLRVTILAGPVRGPIRYDTADEGDWVYVQPEAGLIPGWVWTGRLTFK